jgi:CPA1 family monovalent cation:H+ antiporter
LLHLVLGLLLFAASLHVDLTELRNEKWTVLILATASVIISTIVFGGGIWALFQLAGWHCHLWMPPALQAVLTSSVEMLGLQSSIRPCGAVGDRWPWWNPRIGAPST